MVGKSGTANFSASLALGLSLTCDLPLLYSFRGFSSPDPGEDGGDEGAGSSPSESGGAGGGVGLRFSRFSFFSLCSFFPLLPKPQTLGTSPSSSSSSPGGPPPPLPGARPQATSSHRLQPQGTSPYRYLQPVAKVVDQPGQVLSDELGSKTQGIWYF